MHNLPVVSDLHSRFPDAQIDWVVEESFVDIPRLHPCVRRVIPVALRRWRKRLLLPAIWREMASFRDALQTDDYDAVLDTQGLIKSGLIARQAGLSTKGRRYGYAAEAARERWAARFYDEVFAIPKNAHAVERNRWLAATTFGYVPDLPSLPLDYGIQAAPLAAAWLPAIPYAVLLTATSRADKLWPEEDWLKLAAALSGRGLACVLPAGSAAERDRATRLTQNMDNATLAPMLTIAGLAGLCAGARLVVGLDTGLTHLAAALDKPTLALFAGSDPALTGVYAGDRARNLGAKGVSASIAEVVSAVTELLG